MSSMKAERLVPQPPELPQCEARRVTRYANDRKDTDFQCKRRAKFRVGRLMLCTKHAGVEALLAALKDSA